MGNFSQSRDSYSPKKKELNPAKDQKPSVKIFDNRQDNALQLKLSGIINSNDKPDILQRNSIGDEKVHSEVSVNEKIQLKSQEEEEVQLKSVEDDEFQLKELEEEEVQLKALEEDELQMKALEDEEDIQLKTSEEEDLQLKSFDAAESSLSDLPSTSYSIQRKENKTGLPDQLKAGVESLSGLSLNDVKVHYNSEKPAQLNAHAYAQGSEIHLAAGQEKHLPHEAWHVVQQKQGRVRANRQLKGNLVAINDDKSLETEADIMGAKALQLREKQEPTVLRNSSSQIVQRNENTEILDSRMNYLVQRVLGILKVLMAEGQNWEEIYGDKGEDLAEKGVKTAKESLFGGGKKKDEPSVKEKVIKEALKRWWGSLSFEDKADVVKEGEGFFRNFLTSSTKKSASKKKESETTEKEVDNEASGENIWFNELISKIEQNDIEEVISLYKDYKKVHGILKEFESDVTELAKEIGSSIGSAVGKIRTEKEFVAKFEEQKEPFLVAKLEFAFLKKSITDQDRYQEEITALEDVFEKPLQGPKGMITNPSGFTKPEAMKLALKSCSIAYYNLLAANIIRNSTSSVVSNVKNWFKAKKDQFIGKSTSELKSTTEKQNELVSKIAEVCGKSWSKHTYGIFSFKPNGVKKIEDKLRENLSSAEKLAEIKSQLSLPEIELGQTEEALIGIDKEISSRSENISNDWSIDALLSKTRTQESSERLIDNQLDNSSELASLGKEKVNLELKKQTLKKQIKGSNRKPLTQVFYNAIKDLEPNNELSLSKTIRVMSQIGAELDNSELTKSLD